MYHCNRFSPYSLQQNVVDSLAIIGPGGEGGGGVLLFDANNPKVYFLDVLDNEYYRLSIAKDNLVLWILVSVALLKEVSFLRSV